MRLLGSKKIIKILIPTLLLLLLPTFSVSTELKFPIDTFENITVNQNIFLGGQILLEVDKLINASILPTEDDSFDLGTAALRWLNGFFSNDITALTFTGNNSQWSKNNGNVFLTTSSDNVGIGTTLPSYKLSVHDSNTLNYASTWGSYVPGHSTIEIRNIQNTNLDFASILFRVGAVSGAGYETGMISLVDTVGTSAGVGVMTFQIRSGSNLIERMRIQADGNVGIGTTGPDANLEVVDDFMVSSAAEANGDLFTVLSSGNVGIGTTSPTSKLHVIGDINATGNITSGNSTIILDGNNNVIKIEEITLDGSDSLTITNGNPVEVSVQIDGSVNISTNLTVNELLILPNIIQLSPSQSTVVVRDDSSGVVGTKFGIRNTVASSDADNGVSYILDVGSGNNMSLDLHSSLDPNNPLTVVSHYNNNVRGHVWRLNPANENAFFRWETGKNNGTMTLNKTGKLTIGNKDVALNITGFTPGGTKINCGVSDDLSWSCS